MAESPAEYVARLESTLRAEVAARKSACATAAIAIGRLQEAEKIVQYLRTACESGELHWNDVEALLNAYDAYVKSTTAST